MADDHTGTAPGETSGQLGRGQWRKLARRLRGELKNDNVGLIAAGVAFYGFFSLFPTLFSVVAIYGLVADADQVAEQVAAVGGVLPSSAQGIVEAELTRLASGSSSALGWGLGVSLAIALWSAGKGIRGLIGAMNIAYDEEERRGFVKRAGLTLVLTVGGVVTAIVAIALVAVVPAVLSSVGLGGAAQVGAEVARWIILIGLVLFGLAVLYRVGPCRASPKWRWVTPGSVTAAVLWLLASVGFSLYIDFFSNYQKTFGSLAGVAILLMWFYISALVIIVGAEINAVSEATPRSGTTRPSAAPRSHGAEPLGAT